jgi:hypothetical protein
MLTAAFTRSYVINLPVRSDRRSEMAAELAGIGKSFSDRDVALFPATRPADAGSFESIGAHGCFLSHLGALADAETRGEEAIALLEDDVAFASDFRARAPVIFEELRKKEWGVFYGGHRGLSLLRSGLCPLPPAVPVLTAHFIAFRGPAIGAARRYLEEMLARPAGDARGGPMHVDGAYGWFRKDHPQFETYVAAPPLADQRSSRSDIASLKWFDRAPGVREAAQLARRFFKRD